MVIAADDYGIQSIEFVGDAQDEIGRYATHAGCAIGLRHQWLIRNTEGQLVPLTSKNARKPRSWANRLISRFFAWGATKFQPTRRFE